MKALKSARTLAASLGVLAVGAMAASPAMAFDDVDWDWYKDVYQFELITAFIHVDIYPDGLVEVEKLQIFLGDVHAYNHVSHIYNNPIYPEADKRYVNGYEVKDSYYAFNPYGGQSNEASISQINTCVITYGGSCTQGNTATINQSNTSLDLWGGYGGNWYEVAIKPLDATTQLPILLASATAVGNNQSITSDVPVYLHDGQFVANTRDGTDCKTWCDMAYGVPTNAGGDDYSGNLHHTVALLFGIGALTVLEKAEIHAYSQVDYVYNVSVDNSSTAVANNIDVNLASDNTDNHVVIADITQFALADVKAQTYTHNVYATGYSNMRQLTTDELQTVGGVPNQVVSVPTPWVSSTATAVGNNTSIRVTVDSTN